MEDGSILTRILTEAAGQGWIDWLVMITGLVYIILAARNNVWCWFWGIISCTFWAYGSYAYYKLYMDALLQLFYVAMGFYGIYQWKYGGTDNQQLPITQMTIEEHALVVLVGTAGGLIFGYLFSYTSAAATYPDAFTTVFAILTTFLLVRKKLENWWYWVVIDAAYILLYSARGAYLFALLMVIYVIIAIGAFYQWRRVSPS